MAKLCSVGLDVGTTTTQLIVSELNVENKSGAFSVPELSITDRKILYESPVHFTPLLDESHVDGHAIRKIVEKEYQKAGITRQSVDTGAIIITGETSRKENAGAVLEALSDLAGEFVVATAGPDLESVLAARGAGALDYSAETGKRVLHMDIGGGTSNLALIEDGKIIRTGCLNVGGRLIKLENGNVIYISPVLAGLTDLQVGSKPKSGQIEALARVLASALEMAAGLREKTALLKQLWTQELIGPMWASVPTGTVISFSGGVADCIETQHPATAFGDMGPALGKAIRESRLCQGAYILGRHTIRATVIGAGCHSAQLSGSTVYHRNIRFPLKNLPVIALKEADPQELRRNYAAQDTTAVLALPGFPGADYGQICGLADTIVQCVPPGPVYVATRFDMAKALGQALALRLGADRPVLCLDRLALEDGSFLDVGYPIGPALPVVIKTLILANHS
jgi:ethanolamine utilization protein EutA